MKDPDIRKRFEELGKLSRVLESEYPGLKIIKKIFGFFEDAEIGVCLKFGGEKRGYKVCGIRQDEEIAEFPAHPAYYCSDEDIRSLVIRFMAERKKNGGGES